jgi:hypothetical protein
LIFLQNIGEHWSKLAVKSSQYPRFFHAHHVKSEAVALGMSVVITDGAFSFCLIL